MNVCVCKEIDEIASLCLLQIVLEGEAAEAPQCITESLLFAQTNMFFVLHGFNTNSSIRIRMRART